MLNRALKLVVVIAVVVGVVIVVLVGARRSWIHEKQVPERLYL